MIKFSKKLRLSHLDFFSIFLTSILVPYLPFRTASTRRKWRTVCTTDLTVLSLFSTKCIYNRRNIGSFPVLLTYAVSYFSYLWAGTCIPYSRASRCDSFKMHFNNNRLHSHLMFESKISYHLAMNRNFHFSQSNLFFHLSARLNPLLLML